MIKILRQRTLDAKVDAARDNGYAQALSTIRWIMEQKNRVYLAPVTLKGNNQTITNNLFWGIGKPALIIKDEVPKIIGNLSEVTPEP